MPKTITVTIRCLNTECDSVATFNPEHEIAPAPMVPPPTLRGWLSIASTSGHMQQYDHLCPKCSAQLPAGALAVLRRDDEHAEREQWAQVHHAALQAGSAFAGRPTTTTTAPIVEDEAEPLPSGWSAANVESRMLGLLDAALNEAGHDFDRAARALVARFDATPEDERREIIEAIAFAVVRGLSSIPPHIKTQFVTLALAFHNAPGAAHVPPAPFQHKRANGVIHG
jgi:hypothetical protein